MTLSCQCSISLSPLRPLSCMLCFPKEVTEEFTPLSFDKLSDSVHAREKDKI